MAGLTPQAAQLLPTWSFYAVPWAAGLALALAVAPRKGLLRGLGLGLMTVPLWDTVLGIVDSFGPLLQGGVTLRPFTTYELSGLYTYKLLGDLGYLAVGFLLYAGGARFWRQTPHSLAAHLANEGLPLGRRGEGRSAFVGMLGFPALLLGTLLFSTLTAGASSLRQSDESLVFANMTPYHAVLISAAAAFSEELLFRGLLLTALLRAFRVADRPRGVGKATAVTAAIVLQAVVFGLAHSGYATWIHVLLPALFGLVAGFAAWRFGVWAGIVLHFSVDFFAFLSETGAQQAWALPLLNVLFYGNLLLSLSWCIVWALKRFRPNIQA